MTNEILITSIYIMSAAEVKDQNVFPRFVDEINPYQNDGLSGNPFKNTRAMKKTLVFRGYRDILPSYMGIIIHQYTDPYKPISISWDVFVAQ